MKKVVVATKNKGKLKEIKEILKEFDFDVISMEEAGKFDDIEETGGSFEENAIIKASHIQKLTDTMVIADDSGLEVDALNGEPGVYSARYAGEHANDLKNNQKLLEALKDVPEEKRTARFVCAIAVALDGQSVFTVRGTVEGLIEQAPVGTNGFGYDPLFYLPQHGKTMAQLSPDEKNKISHRGNALISMVAELKKRL
ncbi:MAG TPA: non-canonical purine NTP pyrophosphatase [Clostridiales bacterium]|nr:non-canonical purine NTP pyrophosphatase [Clostridiales bacterium]